MPWLAYRVDERGVGDLLTRSFLSFLLLLGNMHDILVGGYGNVIPFMTMGVSSIYLLFFE